MTPEEYKKKQQDEELQEMNYDASEDIFNQEDHISLDENGSPIYNKRQKNDEMEMDLDVPGSDDDNDMEDIGEEDEENNYWSTSDNEDDHEEENEDIID